MKCIILAGGVATRMRPLTEKIPKALILVAPERQGSQEPFLHYQLEWLSRCGIREVVLSVGYKGNLIREFVGDGHRWGISVEFVDEGCELRGTGGALRLAFDQGVLPSEFLVTYGDSFLPISFLEMAQFFYERCKNREEPVPSLMAIFQNHGAWDTSNVSYNQSSGKILYQKNSSVNSSEDPSFPLGEHPTVFSYIDYGVSILESSLVEKFIPPGEFFDLARLFEKLSGMGLLMGYEVFERFYEIGSPSGLETFKDFISKG